MKENEEGLRGHPGYDQEGNSRDSQYQERFEMMIVSLWAVVVVAVYRTIQGNASTPAHRELAVNKSKKSWLPAVGNG